MNRATLPLLGIPAAAALALPPSAGQPPAVSPPAGPPLADAAIVRIVVGARAPSREVATGFEARPGRIVTVAHALSRRARVVVRAGRGPGRPARVLRLDRRDDLALLAARAPAAQDAPAGASGAPRILALRGARAAARPALIRRRIVAHVGRAGGGPVHVRSALELAARVRPGDSGAPLVDAHGRLTGVVFARSERRAGVAYAVEATAVERLLRGLPRTD